MISIETLKRLAIATGIIAAIWLLLPATRPMQAATPPIQELEPAPLVVYEVLVRFAGGPAVRLYMSQAEAIRLRDAPPGSFNIYKTYIEARYDDGRPLWLAQDRQMLKGGREGIQGGVVDIVMAGKVRVRQSPEQETTLETQ
jgi:hypothetical protein